MRTPDSRTPLIICNRARHVTNVCKLPLRPPHPIRHLRVMKEPRKVAFLGAPFCEGQSLLGADLAPCAMREAGLATAIEALGMFWIDAGDIDFSEVAPHTAQRPTREALYREWLMSAPAKRTFSSWAMEHGREAFKMPTKRKHPDLDEAIGGSTVNVLNAELMGAGLKLVYDKVHALLFAEQERPPPMVLTVGGDHSIASASLAAVLSKYPDCGVIWVDAHADANTPRTSPSGHYHGMPAAHLMGWFEQPGELGEGVSKGALKGFSWFPSGILAESKLAYIGLRDVDLEEGKLLRKHGVRLFTMRDVDKHGIAKVIEMAIEAVGPSLDCPLHLSLDIDSVDPFYAPGTGTTARGGLSYREVHYICEECALTNRLVSMDLVEVNVGLDPPPPPEEMHGDNPDLKPCSPTVHLANEIALSALGKQIC